MNEVSLFRLYVLRAMYLIIVVGLGVYLWPGVVDPNKHWELRQEAKRADFQYKPQLTRVSGLRDFWHSDRGSRYRPSRETLTPC